MNQPLSKRQLRGVRRSICTSDTRGACVGFDKYRKRNRVSHRVSRQNEVNEFLETMVIPSLATSYEGNFFKCGYTMGLSDHSHMITDCHPSCDFANRLRERNKYSGFVTHIDHSMAEPCSADIDVQNVRYLLQQQAA